MNKKKTISVVILFVFLIGFLFAAYKYLVFSKEYATTNAIFIRSDRITNLSFKRVEGKVIKLLVKEGDIVKKGELIAAIDPVDYRLKYQQAIDKVEALEKKREKLITEKNRINAEIKIKRKKLISKIAMLKDKILSVNYSVEEINTNIAQLKRDYNRYKVLFKKNVVAKRDYEKIKTSLNALIKKKLSVISSKMALEKEINIAKEDLKILNEELKRVKELKFSILSINKNIEAYKKQAKDLLHSIEYCKLYAPFDGSIGKKYVEIGMNIKSGYPVYSLVDKNSLYVEVLLEETKLKGVKVGCKAYFTVDAYKNKQYEGVVEKIYPASAATYALVPRDISAGEFTKVAQRIIIRVKITRGDTSLLIPGMGGEIQIRREL